MEPDDLDRRRLSDDGTSEDLPVLTFGSAGDCDQCVSCASLFGSECAHCSSVGCNVDGCTGHTTHVTTQDRGGTGMCTQCADLFEKPWLSGGDAASGGAW